MKKTAREKQIDSKALGIGDKMRKKSITGQNEAETVEVKLSGHKKVEAISLNYRKLKLTKKDADLLSEEIKAAVNEALLKYQKAIEREIEKI